MYDFDFENIDKPDEEQSLMSRQLTNPKEKRMIEYEKWKKIGSFYIGQNG